MKKLLMITILAASNCFAGIPIEKMVPISSVFTPNGFDNNDNSEVIVEGFLPNLCHKNPSSDVKVDGKKISIKVTSLYYHKSNPYCPQMLVPFILKVDLGLLDAIEYEIVVNKGSQWESESLLNIKNSNNHLMNDFQYANVDHIKVSDIGDRKVVLEGYNPSDCLVLDEIKYIHNGKDVLSVMPIMKQVSDFCPMKQVAFEYEWEVPKVLDNNKILLHVRTMQGNSVNQIFNQL